MRGFKPVFKKELYAFFNLPIFYVVCTIFAIISGYFFYSSIGYFSLISLQLTQSPMGREGINITDFVITPWFRNISVIMLLLMPILSMRLLSEEKKSGTMELLFTLPVKDIGVVTGKYLSALLVFLIMLSTTLPGIAFAYYIGDPEWGKVITGYAGLILLGAAFLSIGVFTSSITENQIIASVLSFGALIVFWVIGWAKTLAGHELGVFLEYLSIMDHLSSFTRGILDLRDIVFYILFIVFFLFTTMRRLESQRG